MNKICQDDYENSTIQLTEKNISGNRNGIAYPFYKVKLLISCEKNAGMLITQQIVNNFY